MGGSCDENKGRRGINESFEKYRGMRPAGKLRERWIDAVDTGVKENVEM